VVVGTTSEWARRRRLTLADLADAPWVNAPADSVVGSFLAKVFRAHRLPPPKVKVVSFSMYLRNSLLAKGRHVGLVPGSVLRFSADRFGLKALPIRLPAPDAPVAVVTLKNRTLSPVAKLFADCAREVTRATRRR